MVDGKKITGTPANTLSVDPDAQYRNVEDHLASSFSQYRSKNPILSKKSPSVSCYKGLVMHNTVSSGQKLIVSDDFYINRPFLSGSYILPGSGRKPTSCVGLLPIGFCPSCGKIKLVSGNCGSPECPNCSTQWRYERTKKIFERLFSYKITKKTRMIHAVVSLPQGEIDQLRTKDDIDELRSIVYRYCETKGFDGGLVIFHPWRLFEDKKEDLRNIASGLDEWAPGEFALWKTLIKLENWRDFVYFSPHFHILGAASWLVPAFKDEGWVFKRIRDINTSGDIVRVSMYLLSHAGISLRSHTKNVYWFGGLSANNWSINKAPEKVQQYTISELKKELTSFSIEGDNNYLVCSECFEEFLPISYAPHYYSKFTGKTRERLRMCFMWYCGTIPPPSKAVLVRMELI